MEKQLAVTLPFDYNFFHSHNLYLEPLQLHYYYHQQPGNVKRLAGVNGRRCLEAIEAEHGGRIMVKHGDERYSWQEHRMCYSALIYVLRDGLTLEIEDDAASIIYDPGKESMAQELLDYFRQFKAVKKRAKSINLVVNSSRGLDLARLRIRKPKLSIISHYNDDFLPVHHTVLKSLKAKQKSGLILFHGRPGTGKSTYIRYLIHQLYKKVIFLPPKLAGNLDSPGIVSLLIENPDSVIVIEDAEDLLVSRENNSNSSISMLLNLTDGLLGEGLGIQVIATFNTHIQNIDKALLRKGRLIALYEFKELCTEKARTLLQQLTDDDDGFSSRPMSLADIYHRKDTGFTFREERNSIGFMNN